MSFNKIAKVIPCSPSLLLHLNAALGAPKADLLLAREGKLTTNELVRRAIAEKARQEAKRTEALEQKRTRESIAGSKAICEWLKREGCHGPMGESIILQAQRFLADGEQTGELPKGVMPVNMPTLELIKRMRPPDQETDEVHLLGWFGFWLAKWAYYLMPDSMVRYRAIELAYGKQYGR
jgi:hypothetical protein